MAQFDVNPYHWPGWMQAALTTAVAVLALFFFVETRSFSQARPSCDRTMKCLTGLKLEAQLQTKCNNVAVSLRPTHRLHNINCGFLVIGFHISMCVFFDWRWCIIVLHILVWLWISRWNGVHRHQCSGSPCT